MLYRLLRARRPAAFQYTPSSHEGALVAHASLAPCDPIARVRICHTTPQASTSDALPPPNANNYSPDTIEMLLPLFFPVYLVD